MRWNLGRTGLITLSACAALGLSCGDDDGNDTAGGTGTATDPSTSSASTSNGTESTTTASTTTASSTTATPTSTTDGTDGGSSTGEPACPYTPVGGTPAVGLDVVATGFNRPLLVVGHPTEPDRLFVVEQGGTVRLLDAGETTAPTDAFLTVDVASATNTTLGSERGLLGFALHPDFPTDNRVYIAYNAAGQAPTIIDEYTVENETATFERNILRADQPDSNHNGCMIAFGPDGYLYISLGDGGGGDDAYNTSRNEAQILAKILRIGVEPDQTPDNPEACDICGDLGPFDYTIPDDNPFVKDTNFAPETYAWGFRNPWRFSFDQETGRLYVGDVGQGQWEEITVVEPGSDHGWGDMEGNHCFNDNGCDDSAALGGTNSNGQTIPIAEYAHTDGRCSVTGLGVYRSCEVEAWDGVYFYADYCGGQGYAVAYDGASLEDLGEVFDLDGERILGGGTNAYGDVFVAAVQIPNGPQQPFADGIIYRLAPQ